MLQHKHDTARLICVTHAHRVNLQFKTTCIYMRACITRQPMSTEHFLHMSYVKQGQLAALEQYVSSSGAVPLLMWWARLCESRGDFTKALACYERAGEEG